MSSLHTKSAVITLKLMSLIYKIIGWAGVVFFGIGGIGASLNESTENPASFFVIAFSFFLLSIFLILYGTNISRLIRNFYKYSAQFSTDPTNSISTLADTAGISVDHARKNIIKMINKGLFKNAYIDTERNCLVFPQSLDNSGKPSAAPAGDSNYEVSTISIQCTGCGATNEVPVGKTSRCEYCGSSVSA